MLATPKVLIQDASLIWVYLFSHNLELSVNFGLLHFLGRVGVRSLEIRLTHCE